MAPLRIRVYGDPVLRRVAEEVTDIDGAMADLCQQMFAAMYEAPGIGLAAPQVGVSQRFFVYDFGDGPGVLVNPEITESDGESTFNEGCLSVPELSWEIVRPRTIHLKAYDDYLDEEQRREANRILRERAMGGASRPPASGDGLTLP